MSENRVLRWIPGTKEEDVKEKYRILRNSIITTLHQISLG
jgi:hypothetical protein